MHVYGWVPLLSTWNCHNTISQVCAWVLSRVWLCETPWTVACQAPLSMGIFQARILEWVAMPFSKGSSQPKDQTLVSCIAGRLYQLSYKGSPNQVYCNIKQKVFFLMLLPWVQHTMRIPRHVERPWRMKPCGERETMEPPGHRYLSEEAIWEMGPSRASHPADTQLSPPPNAWPTELWAI